MQDKKQLKAQGLRFARSLQTVVKMVNMFSVDHQSTAALLQRTYELLNPLMKQSRTFTLGFIDRRTLINNVLTAEESLKPLENEFLKRGIGAVTFEAGLTMSAFREAISAIAANPRLMDEQGGLVPFLEQRRLEFVRVFPAGKTEKRNEDGDTVLDMGSEEFLISKALSNLNGGLSQGIDTMLSQMEAAALSAAGASGHGAAEGPGAAFDSGSGSAFPAASGNVSASCGSARSNSGGSVLVTGAVSSGNAAGYLTEMQRVVEQKFEASLRNPEEDPHKAYTELARMLRTVRPDVVVANLMSEGKAGNPESNQQELTAEVFEDTALRWALKRLSAIPAGDDSFVVEEQVFRVLMRSLQATNSAARLAQKMAEYAREFALPPQTLERIKAEVRWLTLTPKEKQRELLALSHFSPAEFRRCLDLIREFLRHEEPQEAMALGLQYFSIFESHLDLQINEVARVPELLRALAGTHGEFWTAAAAWLGNALKCRKVNQLVHYQVANALVTLAHIAATYEEFELVHAAGTALEKSTENKSFSHENCCSPALAALLQPSAVDRILELFYERKHDASWIRLISAILRWTNPESLDRLFIRLDLEPFAANRLALVRLLARLGPATHVAARKRLQHPQWFVVRNACKLLGDAKDPLLLEQLKPVFAHRDERVQKAALQAVIDSRLPGTAAAIAAVLPQLSPALMEPALYELMYHADPDSVRPLRDCFNSTLPVAVLIRLVLIVEAIQTEAATDLLYEISQDEKLLPSIRDAAAKARGRRWARRARGCETTQRDGFAQKLRFA